MLAAVGHQTSGVAGTVAGLNVVISGAAPTFDGNWVYAVTVIQRVQMWTAIRTHREFLTVQATLASSTLYGVIPECPLHHNDNDDDDHNEDDEHNHNEQGTLVAARHHLQQWLLTVLMIPGVIESPVIERFLTDAANVVPPQYQNVAWTKFDASGQVVHLSVAAAAAAAPQEVATPAHGLEFTMDMMTDDWAEDGGDNGGGNGNGNGNGDAGQTVAFNDEHEHEYRVSERKRPVDEPVSEKDMREMAHWSTEVEMIEDVGSLAHSLGASYMGRSLMLQGLQQQQQDGSSVGTAAVSGMKSGSGTPGLASGCNQTSPEAPSRLDSFQLIKVIGKGSFGKVFLAKEKKSGQVYALKTLKKDYIIQTNQVEHTITERSVLSYIRHPFIVGMHMAFQSKDKLFFVLDYCAGGELFFLLQEEYRLPEDQARFYTAEIVLAISHVHSLKIIYRDLKPENILLDASGHIRLTDFGLSKEGVDNNSAGAQSFCGTPEYLAPEIIKRQAYGRAVDWWSLGAVTHDMLMGHSPFYTKDQDILFKNICNGKLSIPPSISLEAKGVLQGLLTKDPTKRLGSGPGGATDIQRHNFFASIDWEKLLRCEIAAPWKPHIASSTDTSRFDREFTCMPLSSPRTMGCSPRSLTRLTKNYNPFAGFTFQDRGFHAPVQQAGN